MTLQCDNVRQLMIKTDLKHRKYQNNIEATNSPVPVQEYRSCLICESEKSLRAALSILLVDVRIHVLILLL